MKISVIGTGYVGLVTGGCLAGIGHEVVCTDSDASKIKILEDGGLPIYEPGLEKVIAKARAEKKLSFSANPADAATRGDAIFICVGTPPLPNGDADLSAIDHVARMIATEARSPKMVVEKSTVPARTGQELKRALAVYGRKSNVKFSVASNPEFLREGTAVEDFLHPDRIVVGVEDESAEKQMKEIYRPVLEQNFKCPVHPSGLPGRPEAGLARHHHQQRRADQARFQFVSRAEDFLRQHGGRSGRTAGSGYRRSDARGRNGPAHRHKAFCAPGLGFGGFCLPKDLQAFVHLAERSGVDFTMLREAERINKKRIEHFCEKIRQALWVIRGKQIGVLGLAFKANTDDIRFAPAIDLVNQLLGGRRARSAPTIRKPWSGPAPCCRRSNTRSRLTKPRRMPKRC